MAREVFFSFHYSEDCTRASQIRNIGAIHGNAPVRDNDWETITRGGEAAIKRWISDQLARTSCTVVLVGAHTSTRKWVEYEIQESWNRGNGVFGIYIHKLRNLAGVQGTRGTNPFVNLTFDARVGKPSLAAIAPVYDPAHYDSKQVYAYIAANMEQWVEQAIRQRKSF